jgi:hypothetical protein
VTDEQILAHYRKKNPYITVSTAKALHRLDMKFRHVLVASRKAEQEALDEQRRRRQALVNTKTRSSRTE